MAAARERHGVYKFVVALLARLRQHYVATERHFSLRQKDIDRRAVEWIERIYILMAPCVEKASFVDQIERHAQVGIAHRNRAVGEPLHASRRLEAEAAERLQLAVVDLRVVVSHP